MVDDEKTIDTSEKTSIVPSETFKKGLAAADSTPPVVVVLIGPQGYVGKQYAIVETDTVIGRAVECQIYIDDRSLSRSHAKFVVVGQEVSIIDLGSTNKTVVNAETLSPLSPCQLKNNDQLRTGNVIFKFLEQGNIEAVSNRAVYEKSQKDALTGAYSKGALIEKAPEAIKRADVLDEPLSVIIFDIDFFKKINDTYGHPVGDFVLKELVMVVTTKLIRSNDFLARYGGEEFVLILSGANTEKASDVAERIRQTIEAHQFLVDKKVIPITISAGVGTRKEKEDWTSLFDRTDKALYTSKQTGRNKVTTS